MTQLEALKLAREALQFAYDGFSCDRQWSNIAIRLYEALQAIDTALKSGESSDEVDRVRSIIESVTLPRYTSKEEIDNAVMQLTAMNMRGES